MTFCKILEKKSLKITSNYSNLFAIIFLMQLLLFHQFCHDGTRTMLVLRKLTNLWCPFVKNQKSNFYQLGERSNTNSDFINMATRGKFLLFFICRCSIALLCRWWIVSIISGGLIIRRRSLIIVSWCCLIGWCLCWVWWIRISPLFTAWWLPPSG